MKKRFALSIVTAALLATGSTALFAGDNLKDSVAQKETKAIADKADINGNPQAKAKEEEIQAKNEFMAKEDAQKFAMEARIDRMQRLGRVLKQEASMHKDVSKDTPKEIMEAMNLTFKAAQYIKMGKKDEATKALSKASENFAKALKANPKLDLVPVAQQLDIKTFAGDSKIIEKALKTADKLIKEHKTQDARAILMPLRDEMDFTVQYLPMKIYPEVTKKAAEALKKGKDKEALMILSKGFGTFIAVTNKMPIPLMLASDMVNEASKLDKSKKDEAIKLLEAAKEQLKRAELLGYTSKHQLAYKAINEQINAIEKEIKGKNIVEKLYEELKSKFEALFKETRKDR